MSARAPPVSWESQDADCLGEVAMLALLAGDLLQEAVMARKVQVLVGTRKGAFIFESDALRRQW